MGGCGSPLPQISVPGSATHTEEKGLAAPISTWSGGYVWPGLLRGWVNTAQAVCPAPRQKAERARCPLWAQGEKRAGRPSFGG